MEYELQVVCYVLFFRFSSKGHLASFIKRLISLQSLIPSALILAAKVFIAETWFPLCYFCTPLDPSACGFV